MQCLLAIGLIRTPTADSGLLVDSSINLFDILIEDILPN